MIRGICAAAALASMAACGGMPEIAMAPNVERAPGNELPPPTTLGDGDKYIYTLGPLDKISIEVDGMPDLLREVVIDGQGMISYPLAGSVSAAGLTTNELANLLERRMRENHVRDPQVSVNIVEAVSQVLTVDGEVENPGLYPVYRDMTLIQAVALAGGNTEFARTSSVVIFRTVKGQDYVGLYDLKAIRYGNYADPKVYPNDRIVISDSEARRWLQLFQPYVNALTTPLIYLVRR